MSAWLWILLASADSWQPPCADPGSFGEGLPRYCISEVEQPVTTPGFSARIPAGVRWGVCEDGSCLEIRAVQAIPPFAIGVHQGGLKGRLESVDGAESLAMRMQGPMRPCEVETRAGVDWVHCRHDYGEHPAAERLNEGDYYRLVGDRWLGVRYTLSRSDDHGLWRRRLEEFLHDLEPNP